MRNTGGSGDLWVARGVPWQRQSKGLFSDYSDLLRVSTGCVFGVGRGSERLVADLAATYTSFGVFDVNTSVLNNGTGAFRDIQGPIVHQLLWDGEVVYQSRREDTPLELGTGRDLNLPKVTTRYCSRRSSGGLRVFVRL
eukprot:352164-Prorocentrum_minimum.AAC.1